MISGNNSILNQATNAKTSTIDQNIIEKLKLDVTGNIIDKATRNTTNSMIEFLQSKEIIGEEIKDENNEGTGKWQIDVEKLLGSRQAIGNGTNFKDTYILEEKEENGKKNYEVNYYENDESIKRTIGMLNGDIKSVVEEDPFSLRYQYGYLWADFNQNYVTYVDSLTEEQKQTVWDNYLLVLRDSFEEEGDTEEQIESEISSYQYGFSLLNSTQKQQFISELLETIEITPNDTDEGYVWSAKYSRMLIKEPGNYTATLYDCLTTPYKKVEKSINIQNLDEYIIDIGTDQYDCSYYISFKHFENNEYKIAYADRVILKLDGVEMFNGVPPEHDEASFEYWYFQEMNNTIENNKEYMADITGYFGTKEVKFKGKIKIRFIH